MDTEGLPEWSPWFPSAEAITEPAEEEGDHDAGQDKLVIMTGSTRKDSAMCFILADIHLGNGSEYVCVCVMERGHIHKPGVMHHCAHGWAWLPRFLEDPA
jgi:hypothetical protein